MRKRVLAVPGMLAAVAGAVLVFGPASGAPEVEQRRGPAPAPYVHPFADKPGKAKPKIKSRPTTKVKVPASIDGCDHAYGEPGQCVPYDFPKMPAGQNKCEFLEQFGLSHVTVRGADRHRLDKNRNGIACDG